MLFESAEEIYFYYCCINPLEKSYLLNNLPLKKNHTFVYKHRLTIKLKKKLLRGKDATWIEEWVQISITIIILC